MSTAPIESPTFSRLRRLDFSALAGISGEVVAALEPVLAGTAADRALDRLLRANRGWTASERTAAAEALFGVSLWRRRLVHHAAGRGGAGVLLAHFLRDLVGLPEAEACRLAGWTGPLASPRPPPDALAERWSVPDAIGAIIEQELGCEAEAFLEALNRPGPICLRANGLHTDREALRARLAEEGTATELAPFARTGLVASKRFNVLGSPAHQSGLFEVQDEGSQLLGLLLGAKPGDTVLDVCAGAGGKTLLLAAEMWNEGTLLAHDVDLDRLDRLRGRADRAGVRNLRIARTLNGILADRVLVDAPCSEIGALRRGPDVRHRMDVTAFDRFPPLQREILERAAACTRPGGTLVYATCTLRRAENEEVVEAFLGGHPEFKVAAPECDPMFLDGAYFRALPHRHDTDGFFAAVMARVD